MFKTLKQIALATSLTLAAAASFAAPVTFNVNALAILPGSGYGIDASEASGTKLDVRFTAITTNYNFTLNNIGDQYFFKVGTVSFREPDGFSGINAAESNIANLNVNALFSFSSPFGGNEQLQAFGLAQIGSVTDPAVDYQLTWFANTVLFPGGSFDFALVPMSFDNNTNPTQDLTAVITLRSFNSNQVPEPASLALIGLALASIGFARRKRA
ncbi:MAG TPA: PEP-CTERM sorting domain-containing protein [Rhodocyclaceae bacterium]|nr:PEP-CTERM sorting domain-containing protein [Rhodocyclaceae bacterium]